MELGKRIKEYRNTAQMTQEDLAEKMFVSRQTISNWENDKSYPDIHSLLMLSIGKSPGDRIFSITRTDCCNSNAITSRLAGRTNTPTPIPLF